MENTDILTKSTFNLPKKTVLVVPVRRKGKWLGTDHEANFLFKHSYFSVVVPRSATTGAFVDPLTDEERTFLESPASGLALGPDALSVHKRDENYWSEYRVKLDKNVLQLDLSKPIDYIRYKVLLVNKDLIAPSAEEKFGKGTYKFAIVEEGYQNEEKVKAASSKTEAYKAFGAMMHSVEKMRNFLNVYQTQKPGGKSLPPNAGSDFLTAEIEKIVEGDLTGFLNLTKDDRYEEKVLIYNALKARALHREGLTFKLPEGIVIGDTMESVISFMKNPVNNEEVIKLKARIENSKMDAPVKTKKAPVKKTASKSKTAKSKKEDPETD